VICGNCPHRRQHRILTQFTGDRRQLYAAIENSDGIRSDWADPIHSPRLSAAQRIGIGLRDPNKEADDFVKVHRRQMIGRIIIYFTE
jgi:hypothetical protein